MVFIVGLKNTKYIVNSVMSSKLNVSVGNKLLCNNGNNHNHDEMMKYSVALFLLTSHDFTYIFDLVLQIMKGSRAHAPLISVTIVNQ